jgi:hypothetical protein
MLAVLKPIVKVPKIVVSLPALLELVKVTEPVVLGKLVICSVTRGGKGGLVCAVVVVGVGVQFRPSRGSWQPFVGQWYAGGTKERPYVPSVLCCGGLGALTMTSGSASARRSWCAWVPGTSP